MFNYLIAEGSNNTTTTIIMFVLLAIMVVVLIVLPMFTNKRRNKAINDLHSSLRRGDVIKTVGGIVGTIVEIKEISPVDKEMVIETGVGDNKSTLVFDVQAVYQVLSKVDAPATETPHVEEGAVATETAEEIAPVEAVQDTQSKAEEGQAESASEQESEQAATVAEPTEAAAEEKPKSKPRKSTNK